MFGIDEMVGERSRLEVGKDEAVDIYCETQAGVVEFAGLQMNSALLPEDEILVSLEINVGFVRLEDVESLVREEVVGLAVEEEEAWSVDADDGQSFPWYATRNNPD